MTELERAERDTLLDHNTLCRKVAALERDQEAVRQTLTGRIAELEQQVRDLTAQLAQHEAAPYPHVRYNLRDIGEIVLCALDTPDYAIDAQTDGPDAFERLSAADSAPANELPVRVYGDDPTKELPTFRQYAPDSAAGGA